MAKYKPEERLSGLKPEEILSTLQPEEILSGLEPEEIEAYLKKIKRKNGHPSYGYKSS